MSSSIKFVSFKKFEFVIDPHVTAALKIYICNTCMLILFIQVMVYAYPTLTAFICITDNGLSAMNIMSSDCLSFISSFISVSTQSCDFESEIRWSFEKKNVPLEWRIHRFIVALKFVIA
jgi:hypothetical protein